MNKKEFDELSDLMFSYALDEEEKERTKKIRRFLQTHSISLLEIFDLLARSAVEREIGENIPPDQREWPVVNESHIATHILCSIKHPGFSDRYVWDEGHREFESMVKARSLAVELYKIWALQHDKKYF